MNALVQRGRDYLNEKLLNVRELEEYIENASVILNEYESGKVWDIMILIEDELFEYEFSRLYGKHFVVDDHDQMPCTFSRVKSYKWVENDFKKRLPIALWIFSSAIVVQSASNRFEDILLSQVAKFKKIYPKIIRGKYLELRSERHNLRYSAVRKRDKANYLIKSIIVKLVLEISLLAKGNPYPFKILLPEAALREGDCDEELSNLLDSFLEVQDPEKIISISDELICRVNTTLQREKLFNEEFLNKWWLYLG